MIPVAKLKMSKTVQQIYIGIIVQIKQIGIGKLKVPSPKKENPLTALLVSGMKKILSRIASLFNLT